MMRRGELQEVQLADDHVPAETTGRQRPPVRRIVAGLLVVGVGLVATQAVLTARERAAVAELARVPEVLSPVDEVVVVERQVHSEEFGALFGFTVGVLDDAEDGSQTYTWLGGADGRGSWSTQLRGPEPRQGTPTVVDSGGCVDDAVRSGDPGSAARVVCLVSGRRGRRGAR